jgi:superfamily II DNA or RNA helicase
MRPEGAILIVSREALVKLFRKLPKIKRNRLAVVHDEVHGLGSPSMRESLEGEHAFFGYRLGLSATPEREYDQEGSKFIFSELGDVIFRFGLQEAIERGILCPFDYVPLDYELTDDDRARLKAVYNKQSARLKNGNPMSKEEVWTELSKVYKTAEQKPSVFLSFIEQHPDLLKSCIIFVENKEFGEKVLNLVHRFTHKYRTYYAEDDRQHLVDFAAGQIDCLVTCHRISQGIDIQHLKHVILFASARAKLETIQRIGRCIRTDPTKPDKRAVVVDFVRPPAEGEIDPNADQARLEWLGGLSKVHRKE